MADPLDVLENDEPTLLDRVQAELIAVGICRDPRIEGPPSAPPYPVFREPKQGLPAPGEGKVGSIERHDDLVVGLFVAPGVPGRVHEDFFRTDAVDFRIRARNAPLAVAFERALRATFEDKMNWLMGVLVDVEDDVGERIIHSKSYTDLQRLGSGPEGHTFKCAYTFQRYVPALTE